MSDLSMMGIYSGIDMSMVDKIMEAEAAKGTKFTRQKEQYTKSQNAWKDMNTRLDSLYKRLEDLQKPETFNSKSVNMTGPENLVISAGSNAATGNYRVQVQQLATQTRLTGNQVSTGGDIRTELKLSGTFDLNLGDGKVHSIDIEESDSLRTISEKINSSTAESGIRSSIVDNRLVLTHSEFGDKALSVSGSAAESLGFDADSIFSPGQDAKFTIDGLEITRSSNTIDDVIEGLSFNLTNVHSANESTVVSVTENLDKAADALQKFVEQYNSTMNFVKSQLSVGDPSAENNTTGTLSGDGTLMRLQSSLRSMVTNQESHGTSINGLQSLGVTVDRNGTASFDRTVLEKQVKENPNEVKDFFSSTRQVPSEDGEGTVTERKGFATNMRSLVNQYISSSNGIIKTRRDTYDRMIRDVNDRINKFEERLEARKNRYIKQFSALDTAMMKAESQMDFMFSQLGMDSK
ncbi:flagellar filament capping protein FliD [Alkalibacterium olivapovliticus]|uniref:Flagellar hook-associated protein 2 n=1 Tax=Alkalibacterium olivapovliticus TaxID=99907 RepID=A0A2T0VYP5_9LACT|nr:flagellar filament capping protein FliD [Alkalibacterium olivapovliticus]PRY77494.1 flagellar hook-associated protein 2 [Alkalibacterium olivapovliticus]